MNYKNSLQELENDSLYYRLRQTGFCAEGYLQSVERVQMDYRELFAEYSKKVNVVFIIDPPYLSMDCKTYSNIDYWKLGDYLDIINLLEGKSYFYFTSEKSQIIELAQWMSENGFKKNPFQEATTKIIHTTLNHTAKYNDIPSLKDI